MIAGIRNNSPVFDGVNLRKRKEKFLKQKARVIWMSGLSGAGKTTLAVGLEKELFKRGFLAQVIDGDNIRHGLNKNLTFTDDDRKENLRRIAEVSKLFVNCGVITINSFITPTIETRQMAREIIGEEDFIEVYINSPFEVCEMRDVKGLYKQARDGQLKNFTGIDSLYESPLHPDIEVHTDQLSVEECVKQLLDYVLPRIAFNN
jgi:adenylylsulfate kinase